jgi:hypothetical protein
MRIRFLFVLLASILFISSCGNNPNVNELNWQGTWMSTQNYDQRGTFSFNLQEEYEELSGTITISGMGINNLEIEGDLDKDYGSFLTRIDFSDRDNTIEFSSVVYNLDIDSDTRVKGIYSNNSAGDFGRWHCSYSDRSDFSSVSSFALDTLITSPSGLCFDGVQLWVTDVNTPATIYKINATNGTIISSFDVSAITPNPRGLAWDGSTLWCGGDDRLYQLDSLCTVLSSFSYDGDADITYASGDLWCANLSLSNLQFLKINPSTGNVEDTYNCPRHVGGLAFDGTNLWFSISYDQYDWNVIRRMDLSGNTLETYNSPCYTPGGLASDGSFLYCIDPDNKRFFKIGI